MLKAVVHNKDIGLEFFHGITRPRNPVRVYNYFGIRTCLDQNRRLVDLIAAYRLPTRLERDTAAVIDALGKDKKRSGSHIHFVLLDGIGKAVVKPIAIDELKRTLKEILTP